VASGPAGVKAAVYRLVRRIPPGRVLTYGEIAARVGRPGGARAVGQAMRVCPSDLPWHRVVNARGGISPRARQSGMVTQRIRLEQEGVAFRAGRVVLTRHRWLDGRPSRSAEGTRARSPSPGAPPGRVARVARARAWP
jgi:methylated-DNA-protein-cysteine methyltransferase-like protein